VYFTSISLDLRFHHNPNLPGGETKDDTIGIIQLFRLDDRQIRLGWCVDVLEYTFGKCFLHCFSDDELTL
jgi:hypothetical protein